MLGLSVPQVRAWSRAGLARPRRGPGRELRFSFHDLLLLRTARELLAARVPSARVRRALRQLSAQLPAGRSLASVRVTAEGARLVVRDGRSLWHPESGQALLDFEVREVASRVAPLLREAGRAADGPADADSFYEWGCDLEDGAPGEAREAYGRALSLDPGHHGAHLNLGRLLHEGRDLAGAERHYRSALLTRPGDPSALFNLGVALEDQGRLPEALDAYRASLAADPRHADAHHNAGRLCERLGRHDQALRHLAAARRYAPRPHDPSVK
jgi:tetratricopeptide (TPR) repeat protein